jgi:hypothetical protein
MTDNLLLDAALEYLDRGLCVIPVKQADKRPYIKWTQFQKRLPNSDELEHWWSQWPDANIAIVCGKVSGIFCVDADGPAGIEWMNANLPKTGVYSVTSKGVHAIYRIPADKMVRNAVRLAPEVDIRGDGGYFVAPPSRHASGHEYRWQFIMDGWDDLAEYRPPGAGGNLNLDLTATRPSPVNAPVAQGARNNTLAQLAGKWIGAGLDEAEVENLARSWNEKNQPPLGEKELLRTLASIHKTHLRNHPHVEINPVLQPETGGQTDNEVPSEILRPGGILQDLIDYIEVNSTVSVPFFSLAAAITFLGNVAGQKIQTETGLRTNIYSIVLGYSGAGKNAPFSCLPQLLARTGAASTLGPSELTSSTAILKWLSIDSQRVALMMLDEIGLVLKGLKNPNSAACDIPRLLIKLFSSTDRPEIKSYASGDAIKVPWHHLSFYGASTPERFWESLTPGEVADGFLARVLVWESRHDAPMPKAVISFQTSPALEKQIGDIFNMQVLRNPNQGNLEAAPLPKIIPKTQEAQELFYAWAKKYHDLKNAFKTDTAGISSVYGRAAEHAAKLALVHSLSTCGVDLKRVETPSIQWACQTLDYLIGSLVGQIKENIAENDTSRWKQRIIKGIRSISKKKNDGATLRDIQRGPCQGLLSNEIKAILDSLIIGEQVVAVEERDGRNRITVKFYVAKDVSHDKKNGGGNNV